MIFTPKFMIRCMILYFRFYLRFFNNTPLLWCIFFLELCSNIWQIKLISLPLCNEREVVAIVAQLVEH